MVEHLLEVMPEELDAANGGLLAVIAADRQLSEVRNALAAVYGRRVGGGAGGLEQDISVLGPQEAKGLEFDAVVVLEPGELLHRTGGRVGDLYVAMTRPTQRLRLLAEGEVPEGIEG